MRLVPCKPDKKHYYKNNICIHCGLDYNEIIKAQKKFAEYIKTNPTPKEDLDWEAGKLWARSHGLKKEDSLLTKMNEVNKLKKEEGK